jgi:hypothetical protein
MSQTPDPLEAELSALEPYQLSPALRRRVAERLADVPREGRQWLWRAVLAGSLAAACLTVVFLWWGVDRGIESKPFVVLPRSSPAVEVEDSEPTLLAYERALIRSPEEFDALLNKHATVARETSPDLVRIRAFTRRDAALQTLLGEH